MVHESSVLQRGLDLSLGEQVGVQGFPSYTRGTLIFLCTIHPSTRFSDALTPWLFQLPLCQLSP